MASGEQLLLPYVSNNYFELLFVFLADIFGIDKSMSGTPVCRPISRNSLEFKLLSYLCLFVIMTRSSIVSYFGLSLLLSLRRSSKDDSLSCIWPTFI